MNSLTPEHQRLKEDSNGDKNWKQWVPYLSERQQGTVREDYSSNGDAWNYFLHDIARMRAYRWGEDGIAGISDDQQRMCMSLAMWNGHSIALKKRLNNALMKQISSINICKKTCRTGLIAILLHYKSYKHQSCVRKIQTRQ